MQKSESQKNNKAIETFFKENEGLLPPAVASLIKEVMGEYANGDSVLLQKKELEQAFTTILGDSASEEGAAGGISDTGKQRIIDAVEQVKAASSLSEKAVTGILDLMEEMRELVNDIDDDQIRSALNAKMSSALELCTFEDIASQHMDKALNLMQHSCSDQPQAESDPLLSGPSLSEEDGMSQEDIDKLLNG